MIPNILTTMRLFMIPLFAYCVWVDDKLAALIVFVFAGVTDVVDGYIARNFNMITDVGKVYDPLVDKLMQLTVLISLSFAGWIPAWAIWIIVIKEVIMIITGTVLYIKKIIVHSNWYGKAATVIFYAAIFFIIAFNDTMPYNMMNTLLIILIASAVISAFFYLINLIKYRNDLK